ncbi:MAG: ATP phosphoribosyltransferase [Candidatus Moranbacteria bacterium]|nr:ATP phosphoribosyltransferase [Candidatus Moranbacteria bacterium]
MMKLGFPNGSVQDSTVDLFRKVGLDLSVSGRQFKAEIKGLSMFNEAIIMRPQDIPEAVVDGILDAGLCGWDWVVESGMENNVEKITELWYGKKTRAAVKVVVVGKTDKLIDGPDVLVAAEYPNLARTVFPQAKIRFSHGGSEQKVAYLNYDYAVCVTETGRSIVDNGLKVLRVILKSPIVLIAREQNPKIIRFGELLQGGLNAEQYVLVKMNVKEKSFSDVIAVIPAFNSPTVNRMKKGGFAIETLVKKSIMADLLLRLKEKGAEGIISQDVGMIM